MSKKVKKTNFISLGIMIYLFIPVIATFLYSIATKWQTTLLPEGLTLKWYIMLFSDTRFLAALGRSLLVATLSLSISMVVTIPAIFITIAYLPKLEKYLNMIVVLPFAVPGIVLAVGLIRIYSKGPFAIAGTVWILAGAYFIVCLPFLYQGMKNNLKTIQVNVLMDAAELLGASKLQAFFYIILPNMMKGVIVSLLLAFSMLFGEFVLANILVGGNFETVQIYLYNKNAERGHLTSAIVITYFVFILIISAVMVKVNQIMNKAVES